MASPSERTCASTVAREGGSPGSGPPEEGVDGDCGSYCYREQAVVAAEVPGRTMVPSTCLADAINCSSLNGGRQHFGKRGIYCYPEPTSNSGYSARCFASVTCLRRRPTLEPIHEKAAKKRRG